MYQVTEPVTGSVTFPGGYTVTGYRTSKQTSSSPLMALLARPGSLTGSRRLRLPSRTGWGSTHPHRTCGGANRAQSYILYIYIYTYIYSSVVYWLGLDSSTSYLRRGRSGSVIHIYVYLHIYKCTRTHTRKHTYISYHSIDTPTALAGKFKRL